MLKTLCVLRLTVPFQSILLLSVFVVRGALFAMKQKKLYKAEVDKIQNMKVTLESQVTNLELAAQNAQTFIAMSQGSKTMQMIQT